MRHNIKKYVIWKKRSREKDEKSGVIKYAWLMLLLSFVVGIIVANITGKEQLESFGVWNTYFIEKFKYATIRPERLFFCVAEERIPILLLLFFLLMIGWGNIAGILFVGWQGFAAGFMMAASVINFGGKGILLIFAATMPQYLIYIPIYIVYLYLAKYLKDKMARMKNSNEGSKKSVYPIMIGICFAILVIYVFGIFLESYVNPYFLKKIIQFI